MIIKNRKVLEKNKNRKFLLDVLEEGLRSIDTESVIKKRIKLIDDTLFIDDLKFLLHNIKNIYLVGLGKCAQSAAISLEDILCNKIEDGIVVDIKNNDKKFKCIKYYKGDHPFPSENNVKNTENIINLLKKTTEKDLVIFIISGGGSALLCNPISFSCDKEMYITQYLFNKGATIQELNTLRKHLSLARGGFLAKYAYPSKVISIIFSDVPGNDLQFISSGPTVKDLTTIDDAKNILKKYDIINELKITDKDLIETPKDDKYFKNVENILFISNETALEAMKKKSESEGYKAYIIDTKLSGEATDVGKNIMFKLHEQNPKSVFLYGGETTVTMQNKKGKGGRNQETALSALKYIDENEIFASCASDGLDNSDHAGAICDIITLNKARELNLDIDKFLEDHNSYIFFEKVGDYIETGKTDSNVSDLLIAIKF